MNYKLLENCKEGEWVYDGNGKLWMVKINEIGHYLTSDGIVCRYGSVGKLYPLTLHSKAIAESINHYYERICQRDVYDLRYWSDWIKEKMSDLMELDENAPKKKFNDIWDDIKFQVERLEKECELYVSPSKM